MIWNGDRDPQGEIRSLPLFPIVINEHFPFTQSLFEDDYTIFLQSSNPYRTIKLLQESLNKIIAWASPSKNSMIIFQKDSPA